MKLIIICWCAYHLNVISGGMCKSETSLLAFSERGGNIGSCGSLKWMIFKSSHPGNLSETAREYIPFKYQIGMWSSLPWRKLDDFI